MRCAWTKKSKLLYVYRWDNCLASGFSRQLVGFFRIPVWVCTWICKSDSDNRTDLVDCRFIWDARFQTNICKLNSYLYGWKYCWNDVYWLYGGYDRVVFALICFQHFAMHFGFHHNENHLPFRLNCYIIVE